MAFSSYKTIIRVSFLVQFIWAPLFVYGAPNRLTNRRLKDYADLHVAALDVSPVVSHKTHVYKREHAVYKRSNLDKPYWADESSEEETTVKSNVIMITTSKSRILDKNVQVVSVSPKNSSITNFAQITQHKSSHNAPQRKLTPKNNAHPHLTKNSQKQQSSTTPIPKPREQPKANNSNENTVINSFLAIVQSDNNVARARTAISILSALSAPKTGSTLKCTNIQDLLQESEKLLSSGWNNPLEVLKGRGINYIQMLTECNEKMGAGIKSLF